MLEFIIVLIVILRIPRPSKQHFIPPISYCLLADICNHTWIPECGLEEVNKAYHLFIDECDLFEYNCDYERNFEIVNYSDCFGLPVTCPTFAPCPSIPPCPNHIMHKIGDHYVFVEGGRRVLRPVRKKLSATTLPMHILKGKRRYTPIPRCRRLGMGNCGQPSQKNVKQQIRATTKKVTVKKTVKRTVKTTLKHTLKKTPALTVILRRETFMRNGKRMLRIIKGVQTKAMTKKLKTTRKAKGTKYDSDFLE